MRSTKSAGNPVAWILPEGHRGIPKEFNTLDLRIFRLSSPPGFTRVRPNRSAVIAWDWRRATRGQAEYCPEDVISSIGDLPPATGDMPLIVSGPKSLVESLCREFQHDIYWLSISGNGATDPRAVWGNWLMQAPSLSIEFFVCRDGKYWDRFGARELRVHHSSPALTQVALLRASMALVEKVSLGVGPEPDVDSQQVLDASPPSNLSVIRSWFWSFRVSLQIVSRTLKNRLSRANQLADQWVIGIRETQDSVEQGLLPELPQFLEFQWIEPESHRFIADPFLARVGETPTLFFEELFYSDWKGRLKALPLDSAGRPAGPELTILEKPYHLSFPLVFAHASEPDALFLLPEQAQSGNTVLYRSVNSTEPSALQFQDDTTLLPGFPGIDPVICEWGGGFYLFVTNGSYENYDNNLELFFSKSLRGPYRVHPQSPIRLGLRGSRMAGPFIERRGKLYRPAQDCESRYGGQIILYHVDLLSPTAYRETEVVIFSPDPLSPYGLGLHTVVYYEGLVAIDGLCRTRVSGAAMEG